MLFQDDIIKLVFFFINIQKSCNQKKGNFINKHCLLNEN